jgi:methanol:N,N-dimethyl-4-nitrosoaniline oxidoreductase
VITDTTSEKAPYKWLGLDENVPVTLSINDPVLHFSMPQDLTAYLRLRRAGPCFRALRFQD